jgi:hypothetical protein
VNARQRSNSNLKPFAKGQSGNPKGRPLKNPFTRAYEAVAQLLTKDLGVKPTDTVAEAIAKMVAREALKGKIRAVAELANRVEGKPTTRIELSGPGEHGEHTVKLNAADTIEILRAAFGIAEPAKNRDAEPGNPGPDRKQSSEALPLPASVGKR